MFFIPNPKGNPKSLELLAQAAASKSSYDKALATMRNMRANAQKSINERKAEVAAAVARADQLAAEGEQLRTRVQVC